MFEGQTRKPGVSWDSSETWWNDETDEDSPPKEDISCKDGWKWSTDWELDINRAVDSQGYEYADEADYGTYGPVERSYHLARRRLWARVRERASPAGSKVGWVSFSVNY